ncbi:MAG TPA: hypothetical protein VGQ83_07905 [Polyangia bacterium]
METAPAPDPDLTGTAARRLRARVPAALLGAAVVGIVTFRLFVVAQYHVPAGDGLQYHALSQELIRAGRYAYDRPPAPLTYTRLPGYPVFLAYVVDRAVVPLGRHLAQATFANVLLDAATALLVGWILWRYRRGRGVAAAGLLGALTCPALVLLASFGLTESLATFLTVLEVALVLRAVDSRPVLFAALAGLVAGAAQLVRADAVTLVPAVVVGLWFVPAPRRWLALGAFGVAAALVFAPWPVRNLRRFGAPHPVGAEWLSAAGAELPTGAVQWMRTWCSMAPGESLLNLWFVSGVGVNLRHPDTIKPAMFDGAVERARLLHLLDLYNHERFSKDVDRGFARLARERARRAPVRTFVVLPAKRLVALWSAVPEHELPMTSKLLDLPRRRFVFGRWNVAAYLLAAVGAVALARRRGAGRRLLLVCGCAIAVRSVFHSFAVPHAATQRYVVEVLPLVIVLAACGLAALAAAAGALVRRVRQRRGSPAARLRGGAASPPPPAAARARARARPAPPRARRARRRRTRRSRAPRACSRWGPGARGR